MPVISVPGFEGDFYVNPDTGQSWRRGREGGTHHPSTGAKGQTQDYREVSDEFRAAAQAEIDVYRQATSFGNPFEGMEFGPSPEEMELLGLQMEQIRSFMDAQNKIQEREEARRAAWNRFMTGGAFTPKNMEEQQGLLAARAAQIAEIEQTRLKDALEGKLPVSPSTERAIREQGEILAERNVRDFGPGGGTTSDPALKRQALFDESAEILKDVDRKGYIERGIRPSIDAASFAAQQIGEYIPGEAPGIGTALQGLRANRQMAMNAALAGGGGGGGGAGLASSAAYADQARALAAAGQGSKGAMGGALGGGGGALLGGILGAIAGGAWNFGIGAPAGAAIGAGIGGTLGGVGGSSLGSGLTGGSYMPSMFGSGGGGLGSLYGSGGGYRPDPGYRRMAYNNQSFPHTY